GDGHPALLHDVHRTLHQLAARRLDLLRDRVGVVGGQVGRPGRRGVGRAELGAEAGHDPVIEVSDRVAAHLWAARLDIPAEYGLVEGDGLRYIADADTGPAEPAGQRCGCLHWAFMYAKTNPQAGRLTSRQKRIFAIAAVVVVVVFGGLTA